MSGIRRITEERYRQLERWSDEHDDEYVDQQLLIAAVAYVEACDYHQGDLAGDHWPSAWGRSSFKPSDQLHNLAKAGALIAAEIDRLERMGWRSAEEGSEGVR